MDKVFKMNLQLFAAEENIIGKSQMAKARELDFVNRFSDDILKKLLEVLGVTRKIPMSEGTTMYVYKTTGTLQDGSVAEGDIIPLSQYQRTKTPVGEITLKKWRKAVTAEAIMKSGKAEAIQRTDDKLLSDVQKTIRDGFFTFLTGIVKPASGTAGQEGYTPAVGVSVNGTTLQAVLAKSWAQLQVLFENDAAEAVHFINPLTVSDYLGTATVTTQTAFGMNYIENFLGLGTVIMSSQVSQGEVYSTAKDNLIVYYLNMNGDIADEFNLTADDTGFIGIDTENPNKSRAQVETLVMSGVQFLVEIADGVVKGTIAAAG